VPVSPPSPGTQSFFLPFLFSLPFCLYKLRVLSDIGIVAHDARQYRDINGGNRGASGEDRKTSGPPADEEFGQAAISPRVHHRVSVHEQVGKEKGRARKGRKLLAGARRIVTEFRHFNRSTCRKFDSFLPTANTFNAPARNPKGAFRRFPVTTLISKPFGTLR
jgi:hypothetical protein